jgi:tetratricopeptide (TPR) repeat protein
MRHFCTRFPLAILLFGLLAACAAVPQAAEPAAPASAAQGRPAADDSLPRVELDADTLYEVLLGEIAGQRGQIGVASEALSRAARRTRDPRLAERATLAALYAKQYDDALAAAQLWVELRPDSFEARESLASIYLETNRPAEAREQFERILAGEQARDNLEQAYMRIAAVLGRATSRGATVETMQALVRSHPGVAAAHFALAHLAVRNGDLDVAATAVDRALELRPDWEEAALFKARILVSQKNAAKAQLFYEDYLRRYPSATNVRVHYARHLIDQKQWEKARDQFKQVAEEAPEDADAVYAVGLLALQTSRLDEAERYLKRTVELRPQNDQARIYLGQVVEQNKRYGEAARWYGEVGAGEHYFEAQTRLAIVIAKQGDLDKARQHLRSVTAENDQQRVQLVLAEEQMLRDAKRYDEALTVLNGALERLPEDKDLLYARALIAEKLDKLPLLETDLRAILKKDPQNVNALNALGYTLADRTDRHSEAKEYLARALELKPDDPFVLDSMGWLHYRTGNNVEAIKYLKRALGIRNDAEIAAHLGEVLWMAGDKSEARSVWTRALRETPESEALRDVIKKFMP